MLFLSWLYLKEEEIDKVTDSLKYGSIPPECDPNNMSWWQYALSVLGNLCYKNCICFSCIIQNFTGAETDCKKYHKTMLQNVFWKVSPFTVFAHQFGIVIATPANNIGKAIGSLVTGMLCKYSFKPQFVTISKTCIFSATPIWNKLHSPSSTASIFYDNYMHPLVIRYKYIVSN